MPAVLISADSIRSAELRHEVPLPIPDRFLYVEHEGRRVVVVPSIEIPRIDELGLDLDPRPLEEFGVDELLGAGVPRDEALLEVAVRACRSLGVDEAIVPPAFPLDLADRLRAAGVVLQVAHDEFAARRRVKNAAETAGIRRASQAAVAGMQAVVDLLAAADASGPTLVVDGAPLTVERLKADVAAAFDRHGCAAEEYVVSHGPQTAIGHELGSGPIAPGEPVLVDLWPRDRRTGCYSDMTRTFVAGPVPADLETLHRVVLDALRRAVAAVAPGVLDRDLHVATSERFSAAGYPTQLTKPPGEVLRDGFMHSLGHGVGLEVHESPWLGRGGGDHLVVGDVVAVEPGLYRHGWGGCRLEDLLLVTERGCETLTVFPYDLQPWLADGSACGS